MFPYPEGLFCKLFSLCLEQVERDGLRFIHPRLNLISIPIALVRSGSFILNIPKWLIDVHMPINIKGRLPTHNKQIGESNNSLMGLVAELAINKMKVELEVTNRTKIRSDIFAANGFMQEFQYGLQPQKYPCQYCVNLFLPFCLMLATLIHCFQNMPFMLKLTFAHTHTNGCQSLNKILNMLPPVSGHSLLEAPFPCVFLHCLLHYFLLQIVDYVVLLGNRLLRDVIFFHLDPNFGVFGIDFVLNFEKGQVRVSHAPHDNSTSSWFAGRCYFINILIRRACFTNFIKLDFGAQVFHSIQITQHQILFEGTLIKKPKFDAQKNRQLSNSSSFW